MKKVDKVTAKRAARVTALSGLFLVSFLLFLVMTFPYEVLKESIAANLSRATGYNVSIGDMSASLPIGMTMGNVRIEGTTPGSAIEFKGLTVNISILRLLIGQLGIAVDLTAGKGRLTAGANLGLLDLASGTPLPKRITLVAKNFPLDDLISFALSNAANSPGSNPLLAPLLSTIGVSALLNAAVDFTLDPKNLAQSTGQADFNLANAILKLSHPSIGLKDQSFKKAQLKAKLEGGALILDKASAFLADGLELVPEGKIMLRPLISNSQLDLKISFKLTNDLKSSFGFLLSGGSTGVEGELKTQVRGTIDQPLTVSL